MPDAGIPIPGMVHRPLKHDSAEKHVAGTAAYIDDQSHRELVETLDANAATYEAEGKTKAAYVARLLGISLVAGKLDDPRVRQRDQLLSHFIDTAAYVYITQHNARAAEKG